RMTPRVAVETATGTAAADLPTRRIVAAGGAAHHDAAVLEMQHRVVTAQAAHDLSKPRERPAQQPGTRRLLSLDIGGCRELLGIICHHRALSSVPPVARLFRRRPLAQRSQAVAS